MEKELGDAAVKMLIELVHARPVIWDKRLQNFTNNKQRGAAFKEIDDQLRQAAHTTPGNFGFSYIHF